MLLSYEDEVKNLTTAILEQYNYDGKGYDGIDYAHMIGTLSVYQSEGSCGHRIGNIVSPLMGGSANINDRMGWAGDIYGVPTEEGSSINNPDYKSDLDAVNINAMLESDDNLSIMDAKEQYYGNLEKGEINRANEFLRNLGDGNSDKGLEHMINSSNGYQITYGKFSAHDEQHLKNLEEYIEAQKKIKEHDPNADIASALFFEHIIDSKMEWSGN